METQFLVVGAGISGLLISKILEKKNIDFRCVEANENAGGRASVGPQRIYNSENLNFLSDIFETTFPSEKVEEPVFELSKGEWKEFSEKESLSENELFYLKRPFFNLNSEVIEIIIEFSKNLSDKLLLSHTVVRIDLENKTAKLLDGKEIRFQKLVWAGPFAQISKLLKEKCHIKKATSKKEKKQDEGNPTRGVFVEFQLSKPVLDHKNSSLFPFRYKEFKLHAIGQQYQASNKAKVYIGFIVFLKDPLFDDSEEIAKAVRAFKRELEREVPQLKDFLIQEKIIEFDALSGEKPVLTESLQIANDVYYIGPELCLENSDTNIDLVIKNARALEKAITAAE